MNISCHPESELAVGRHLAQAYAAGTKIANIALEGCDSLLEHNPADMTATVQAGIPLVDLQRQLKERGQWLPIDPPFQTKTIGAILAANLNGPRRYGYGTIRDYVIGIKVVLADGRIVKAGGKVVKNVAGFDLCKLFIGSRGSLGIIVEATFKLRPLPETEQLFAANLPTIPDAMGLLEQVLDSELQPVVLDLHHRGAKGKVQLVLGLAGTAEEVESQRVIARALQLREPGNLDHERAFWEDPSTERPQKVSVLPSRLPEVLPGIHHHPWIARAGNGIVWWRGTSPRATQSEVPNLLMRRVKEIFDPKHILPELIP